MDINNTRGMQVIHGRETKIREAVKKLENGEKIDLTQFYVGVHGKFIVEVVKALAYDTRSRQLVIVKNDGAVRIFQMMPWLKFLHILQKTDQNQ